MTDLTESDSLKNSSIRVEARGEENRFRAIPIRAIPIRACCGTTECRNRAPEAGRAFRLRTRNQTGFEICCPVFRPTTVSLICGYLSSRSLRSLSFLFAMDGPHRRDHKRGAARYCALRGKVLLYRRIKGEYGRSLHVRFPVLNPATASKS